MRFNGQAGAWLFPRYPVEGICSAGAFFIASDLASSVAVGYTCSPALGRAKE
jgi:hypothetical protein